MDQDSRRNIPAFETTSLTNKSKSLRLAGIEAKLVFETCAGQAWGTLHVHLGEHPCQSQTPPQEHPLKNDNPDAVAEEAANAVSDAISDDIDDITEEVEVNDKISAGQVATEEVIAGRKESLFLTAIDDKFCDDEEYYDVVDPNTAINYLQCKMDYFPVNYIDGDEVNKYAVCRWHLGVSKCRNCEKNFVGLDKILAHRQICRSPS